MNYLNNNKKFVFGTFVYEYQLIKQNRKTLSLTVTPDLQIILKCPQQADSEKIENFLQRKWFWLEKQLSFFKKHQRKTYKKEYISGEEFLYLGKQYKLIVKKDKKDKVILTRNQLLVLTTKSVFNSYYNKKLIDFWLANKIDIVFEERFKKMFSRFNYKNMPMLATRKMQRRWGSFLNKDKIFLNPKLIHTPKDCIDYVIVHELCHLKYKNHSRKFWKLLNEKYPRWEKVKDKLEMIGVYCTKL